MKRLIVGSRNAGKVKEIKAVLAGLPFLVEGLPATGISEPEETGATFQDNAILKAKYYSQYTGEYCLADDSGLEVDALGGAPGVYSARYAGENATDAQNNRKLLQELAAVPECGRTARFRSVLALISPAGNLILADGVCEGVILSESRGAGGFGYDPLFFMPELGKTLAEMDLTGKNAVSHRGKALRSLKEKLLSGRNLD